MKRFIALAAVVCAIAGGWLARPARWEVEGLSMAPGLMPGDVATTGAFPIVDRWRRPRRFERWTLAAPANVTAVKRVWGLPDEEFVIIDGDLIVDGETLVKPPRVLAEVAISVVPVARHDTAEAVRFVLPDPVFDDVPFAPDERRVLVPVYDVGVASLIDVGEGDPAGAPACVEIGVGGRVVRVAFRRPGRHAVVAGRLDGAFVAAAWPLSSSVCPGSCLPPGSPLAWAVQRAWLASDVVTSLEVRVVASTPLTTGAIIRDVAAWRDVHHLPPASATTHWRLGCDEWFVLGDFPGGSRDSRQWGPVGSDQFHQRLGMPCR